MNIEEMLDEEAPAVEIVLRLVQELAEKCDTIEEFREALKAATTKK